MRGELLAFVIYTILLATVLVIFVFYPQLFFRKQQDKKKSLQSGYGFYSDPTKLPCNSSDGKCTSLATQKTILRCIPHPVTGKGCIDDNGNMTYNNKIIETPCQLQCVGSNFTIKKGVSFTTLDGNEYLDYAGCHRIANKKDGLEYTDFFIGDFDNNINKFKLKNCVPNSDYQFFYEKTYNCENYDSSGPNNCLYTCGQDNVLRTDGLFNSKLSKDVLNYYPVEYDEEGVRKHVCYDINDINQIEILNSVEKIPEDFTYPNICYKHYNVEDINLSTLYPITNNNVIINNKDYNEIQELFYIDLKTLKDNNPNLINYDYNFYTDYENYIKVIINNETTLLDKIIDLQDKYIADKNFTSNYTNNFITYINLGLDIDLTTFTNIYDNNFEINMSNGTIKTVNFNTLEDNYFYEKNSFSYLPFNLLDISTKNSNLRARYKSEDGITYINYSGTAPKVGDYVFIKNPRNFNQSAFLSKIINVDTVDKLFEVNGRFTDNLESVDWYLFDGVVNNDIITITLQEKNNGPKKDINVNINSLFVSGNIYINSNIIDNPVTTTSAHIVNRNFDNSNKDNPIVYKNFMLYYRGFYYGLMLNNVFRSNFTIPVVYKNAHIISYLDTNFATKEEYEQFPFIDDYLEVPFYVEEDGKYYYPLYLTPPSGDYYTKNFVTITGSTLYLPKSGTNGGTNPPDQTLEYKDFRIYQTLTYYVIDVNKNYLLAYLSEEYKNLQTITIPDFPNINFYLFGGLENYIFDSPQNIDLDNFRDFYYSGVINFKTATVQGYELPYSGNIINEANLDYINSNLVNLSLNYNNIIIGEIYTASSSPASGSGFLKVWRKNNFTTEDITNQNNYTEKFNLYKLMLENQDLSFSENGVEIIINPEKKVVVDADFTLFRSPYIKENDGTLTSICYDEYNKPLPKGKTVELPAPSNDGAVNQGIIANVICDNPNTDIDVKCGKYAFDDGTACVQERKNFTPQIINDGEVLNPYNNYIGLDGFMENVLDITDNELYCVEDYNTPYDSKKSIKCFPPFYTKEKEDKVYAPEEEFYTIVSRRNYYYSLVNYNNISPPNPIYWNRLFTYNQGDNINKYESFFVKTNLVSFYQAINNGINTINPYELSRQPLYILNSPNLILDAPDNLVTISNNFPNVKYYSYPNVNAWPYKSNIYNISYSIGQSNIKSLKNPIDSTLVDTIINVNVGLSGLEIKDISKGDIFQSSLSFFNGLFLFLAGDYYNALGGGYNAFSFDANFGTSSNNNDFITNLNQNIINCTRLGDIKVGDYIAIMPREYASFDINEIQIVQGGINTFLTDKINPTFEIIVVENIDTNNKKLTVSRNALNLDIKNLFYLTIPGKNSIPYSGMLINDIVLNDNYNISNIENNTITIECPIKIPYVRFNNLSANFTNLTKDWVSLNIFSSSNVIKKDLEITQIPVNNNLTVFITEKPKNKNCISVIEEINLIDLTVIKGSKVYINEFRKDRYNNHELTFNQGDVIIIGGIQLQIQDTFVYYEWENNNGFKLYDYYCIAIGNESIDEKITSIKQAISSLYEQILTNVYTLGYVLNQALTNTFYHIWVLDDSDLQNVKINKYDNNQISTVTSVNYNDIVFDVYNVLHDNNIGSTFDTDIFNDMIKYQSAVISGINISYIALDEMILYDGESQITINNIKFRGKPEGPANLNSSNPTNNEIVLDGFATIYDFSLLDINGDLTEGQQFVSKGGYKIIVTDKNPVSYKYLSGNISTYNNFELYDNNKIYTINDVVEYISPDERIYYQNNSDNNLIFDINNTAWDVKSKSIFPESSILFYSTLQKFKSGDIIKYDNKLWQALTDNLNITPVEGNNWKQLFLNDDILISNKGRFFTYSYQGNGISSEQLAFFNDTNIDNLPLGLYNLSDSKFYCPESNFKVYDLNWSDTFIEIIPEVKQLNNIFGKFFIAKADNETYISLPSVPYNEANYQRSQYLKDLLLNNNDIDLGFYLYSFPISNPADMGKPFCTGKNFDTNIDDIITSNSLLFCLVPLELTNQDYPEWSYNGNYIKRGYYACDYIELDTVYLLAYKNNNYVYSIINAIDPTRFITNVSNAQVGQKYIAGANIITFTVTKIGHLFMLESAINNNGVNYKRGDIWYISNGNDIVYHGYLEPDNGKLYAGSFISYIPYRESVYGYNLTIISETGSGFVYNNKHADFQKQYIIDGILTTDVNVVTGDYTFNDGMKMAISVINNEIIQLGGYVSTATGNLVENRSNYQAIIPDQIKCKIYAIFGNQFIGQIKFQTKDLIVNNNNQALPGAIFDIHSNDIYSPEERTYKVVGENENNPETYSYTDIYNTFILKNNNAGSYTDIDIFCNFYNKPVNDNVLLNPNAVNKTLNIVNNTELHNFTGEVINFKNNIYLDKAINILATDFGPPTNERIIKNTIRENRSKNLTNYNYDCNVFFSLLERNYLPTGNTYNISQNNGIVSYDDDFDSSVKPLSLKTNLEYIFLIDSNMTNYNISFSTRLGSSFKKYTITSNVSTSEGILEINYYINNIQVSYDDYIRTYNLSLRRKIIITFNTFLQNSLTNPYTFYIGYNEAYDSNSFNTIVFNNN
jgi:hypothetical protein